MYFDDRPNLQKDGKVVRTLYGPGCEGAAVKTAKAHRAKLVRRDYTLEREIEIEDYGDVEG